VWLYSISVDFVGLARSATLDVFFNLLFHVRPPIVLSDQSIGVGDSWVSHAWRVVKRLNYPPLKIIVSHNNESIMFPPELIVLLEVMVVYPRRYSVLVHPLFLSA